MLRQCTKTSIEAAKKEKIKQQLCGKTGNKNNTCEDAKSKFKERCGSLYIICWKQSRLQSSLQVIIQLIILTTLAVQQSSV